MIVVILLMILGISKRDENSLFMSKNELLPLRGAASIYIMLVHIWMYCEFDKRFFLLLAFWDGVILFNGLFFFFSGIGLAESVRTKKGYLSIRSFVQRMFNLLLPAGLSYLVWYISVFTFQEKSEFGDIVTYMLFRGIIDFVKYNDVCWFIIELIALYILFWCLYKFMKPIKANVVMLLCCCIWTVIAYCMGRGIVWYASILCFVLGVWINNVGKIDFKKGMVLFPVAFCVMFCCFVFGDADSYIRNAVAGNGAAVFFCISVVIFLKHFRIGNIVLNFLGKISYEIYLLNIIMIKALVYRGFSVPIVLIGTIVSSILLGTILHFVAEKVNAKMKLLVFSKIQV